MGTAFQADIPTVPAVPDIHFKSVVASLTPNYHTTYIATFNGTARDSLYNIVPFTNATFKIVTIP